MLEEHFVELLDPNLKPLRRFLQKQLKASSHVDDVLQQTLLRAYTHRDQLRVPCKFKSWLWAIAVNELRMSVRGGHNPVSLADIAGFEPPDEAASPLAVLEEAERQNWLKAGMAALPERHYLAIQLIDLEGRSIAQAAEALAISVSATKSVHFRARRNLARALRRTSLVATTRNRQRQTRPMLVEHLILQCNTLQTSAGTDPHGLSWR